MVGELRERDRIRGRNLLSLGLNGRHQPEIDWPEVRLAVPLVQLKPLHADAKTVEAVEDWHYWARMGYHGFGV